VIVIERLNPLNDYLFLKMLGELGDEEELREFLKAILRRTGRDTIASVEISESKKLTADIVGDKTSILDVLAILDDGTHVNIELQIKRVAGQDRRFLQYWSREYARSISAGEDYDTIPGVITVIITDEFDMVKLPEFHTCFHLREDSHPEYVLTDAMEFHILSMPKFRQWGAIDLAGNALHRWLTFLDKKTPTETLEEVIRMDQAIQKVNARMEFVTQDKESLRQYYLREMAMSDWSSGLKLARSEGRAEEKNEIARNAILEGFDNRVIAKITGLDEATINKLRAELLN
jgi:predicted transposase/invertase (TIGR01784 family)